MTIASLDDLARLEARAERSLTTHRGGDLAWHTWGSGSPIVLLHGGSGSWTHWCRNIDALVSAGHRVLVPDLPGFGDSSTMPGITDADDIPPVLEEALSERLRDAPFDLVGFSFGSLVATLLAARGNLPIRRLVLVGAYVRGATPTPPLRLRAWADLPPGPERDAIHRYNLGALMLAQPASIDPFAVAVHGANLGRDRMRRRRIAMSHLLAQTLPQVRCPVTALWGTEDFAYRKRAATVREALQCPALQAIVEIAGAGHWVQFEAPGAFDAALRQALGPSPES